MKGVDMHAAGHPWVKNRAGRPKTKPDHSGVCLKCSTPFTRPGWVEGVPKYCSLKCFRTRPRKGRKRKAGAGVRPRLIAALRDALSCGEAAEAHFGQFNSYLRVKEARALLAEIDSATVAED